MRRSKRKIPRRKPVQARALETCDVIYEATIQILETKGELAFTTNSVAERAGISVGTLYQYFPDKNAILVGLARREMSVLEGADAGGEALSWRDTLRRMLRRYIRTLEKHPATRRAALKAILASASPQELAASATTASRHAPRLPHGTALDAYVLSRAATGVVRAAVLEGDPRLLTPAFEDAVMMLVDGYALALERQARRKLSAAKG